MKKRFTKNITWYGELHIMYVDIGFTKIGEQEPYFSVTGKIWKPMKKSDCDSCGCLHDEVREFFPELAHLIQWHLVDNRGPMHYKADGLYWLKYVLGVSKDGYYADKPEGFAMEAFKNTVCFQDGEEVPTIETFDAWSDARLPSILEKFHHDTDSYL